MPSYRLLRSNKESGPYSVNDLVELGLKPYDLVWVEGRSAAWRYPSEISELKPYAPIVEEQPYDRFYKKPSPIEEPFKEPVVSRQEEYIPPVKIQPNFIREEPVVSREEENIPPLKIQPEFIKEELPQKIQKESEPEYTQPEYAEPKKKITEIPVTSYPAYQPQLKKQVFVSMPESNGYNENNDNNGYRDSYSDEKYQKYLPKDKPVQQKPIQQRTLPVEERSYTPINIKQSEDTKLETKYTQSLDDIKEMYVNTLVQRKTRNRKKEIVKKYLKPALVPVLLLLAGVAIGFVMTRKKTSLQAAQPVSTVVPSQNVPQQKKEETPADQNNNTIVLPDDKQNSLAVTDPKQEKPSENQQTGNTQERKENKNTEIVPKTILPEKKEPVKKEKETAFVPDQTASVQKETSTFEKKSVEVDPSTGERKKIVRDNDNSITLDNNTKGYTDRSTKKNEQEHTFLENDHKDLRELVSVKTNNYLRGSFGGIKGLELTLYNNSGVLLDEVSVELQIMKPSELPLRTDIITFKNISANGTVTVKVPDSQRGIRVDYKITNISSKQWQKNTAGL